MFPLTSTVSETTLDMYPTAELDEAVDEAVRDVTEEIKLAEIIPLGQGRDANKQGGGGDQDTEEEEEEDPDPTPRPGHAYAMYKAESALPETARKFYETAANLSGFSLNTLIAVVYRTELKLEKFQLDVRRAELYDERIPDDTD